MLSYLLMGLALVGAAVLVVFFAFEVLL